MTTTTSASTSKNKTALTAAKHRIRLIRSTYLNPLLKHHQLNAPIYYEDLESSLAAAQKILNRNVKLATEVDDDTAKYNQLISEDLLQLHQTLTQQYADAAKDAIRTWVKDQFVCPANLAKKQDCIDETIQAITKLEWRFENEAELRAFVEPLLEERLARAGKQQELHEEEEETATIMEVDQIPEATAEDNQCEGTSSEVVLEDTSNNAVGDEEEDDDNGDGDGDDDDDEEGDDEAEEGEIEEAGQGEEDGEVAMDETAATATIMKPTKTKTTTGKVKPAVKTDVKKAATTTANTKPKQRVFGVKRVFGLAAKKAAASANSGAAAKKVTVQKKGVAAKQKQQQKQQPKGGGARAAQRDRSRSKSKARGSAGT
eukprot:CAMPEP_0196802238 /NCGR_PEP_ID=MMETSP1362-20130617/1880_1 /TAXON_ID=163516 /ORGANISM="Leptocylindrus danicus, Strain CCMP1856" /LENGTH=371 /DNA_ID=CAMNT_0042173477 /DNA_START=13 /DNA_END=1128 /DNA_ORIENTATION=+